MPVQRVGSMVRPSRAALARTRTVWLSTFQDHGVIRDAVSGGATVPAGGTRIESSEGAAFSFLGGTGNGAVAPFPAFTASTDITRYAVIARVRATAVQPGNPGAAFGLYASGSQGGIGIGFNSTNQIGAAWLSSSGAGLVATQPSVIGQWYTVIVQGTPLNISGGTFVWLSGGTRTEGSTSQGTIAAPINEVAIGAQHRSSGYLRQLHGQIAWGAILEGDAPYWMTDEIAASLFASNYPHSLQAQSRTIWLPPTGDAPTSASLSQALAQVSASSSGVLSIAGLVNTSLSAATLTATGSLSAVAISGVVAATLEAASSFAPAKLSLVGDTSSTLAPVVLTATGSASASATLASPLAAATLAASGSVSVAGQVSATLGAATLTATGAAAAVPTGTLAATLAAATLSATATIQDSKAGTLSATLGAATLSATGVVTDGARGQVEASLAPATLVSTGTVAAVAGGQVSAQLAEATLSASANLAASGAAAVLLDALTAAGAGTSPRRGDVAATLSPAALVASATLMAQGGGVVSAVLGALAGQASGQSTLRGQVGATLDAVSLAGAGSLQALQGGTVSQQLQALSVTAPAALQLRGASSVTFGDLQLVATGAGENAGDVVAVLGDLTLLASGRDPSIPQFLTVSRTRRVSFRLERRVVRPNLSSNRICP